MMHRDKMSELLKNITIDIPEPNPGDYNNKR